MEARELKPGELEELLSLYCHLHGNDDPLPDRQYIKRIWHEIQASACFKYFDLLVDQRLISSCTLSIIPNLTRGCRPYGVIENVVTHSEFRRRGYAGTLLKHALNQAWQESCYKVMLLTGRKDEGIYNFYESVGFDRNVKQAFLARR